MEKGGERGSGKLWGFGTLVIREIMTSSFAMMTSSFDMVTSLCDGGGHHRRDSESEGKGRDGRGGGGGEEGGDWYVYLP